MSAATDVSYDVNFCFSVPERIENTRVALTPFNPILHGETFYYQATLYPEIFKCFTFGPFNSASDFYSFVENTLRSNPGSVLFCVWDKTKKSSSSSLSQGVNDNGVLAGLIGLINSSRQALATEIGPVLILPPFHRTHVASNAVGLLLHYSLETWSPQDRAPVSLHETSNEASAPSVGPPHPDIFTVVNGRPLGLRRVVWQADARNAASIRLAERMGFRLEAVQRWGRVLPVDRPLNAEARANDPRAKEGGLNAAMLSLCWDDWETGARDRIQVVMQRTH